MTKESNVDKSGQIVSKKRVIDYGEVFTPPRMVAEMSDLVKQETTRIGSRFLDPACGHGNFLAEILRRKLTTVEKNYSERKSAFERYAVLAVSSIYGIDILEDNILDCRKRLFDLCNVLYTNLYGERCEERWREMVRLILEKNIVLGDTVSMTTVHGEKGPIIFTKWSIVTKNKGTFFSINSVPEALNMTFDVVIGNPPYQLDDGGFGRSARPIYQHFIRRAKELNPRFLIMIIPSRWFTGGKGLDEFRKEMLSDDRIRKLVDFDDSSMVFTNVEIAGGVCYFLWDRDNRGKCEVVNVCKGYKVKAIRPLDDFDTFIRHNQAVSIVRKVMARNEKRMSEQVSACGPFGLRTCARPQKTGDLILRWRKGEGPYKRSDITVGIELIDTWKVITSYTSSDYAGRPDANGRRRVFCPINILPPRTICTETYLVVGSYKEKKKAENLVAYMQTKFFRFLVAQHACSQQMPRGVYSFVPILDMSTRWTDDALYRRYGLTNDEIAFIESKISPMKTMETASEVRR